MEHLAASAREHGLVVLAGAGISMIRPSALPGWNQLNTRFLEGLSMRVTMHTDGDFGQGELDFLVRRRDETGRFPPDFQAQLVEEECGADYFRVLQMLDIDAWNECHAAIAALASAGVLRGVVTTNFDRLIEHALRSAEVEPRVFSDVQDFERLAGFDWSATSGPFPVVKAHGSVEAPESMVDTLKQRVEGRPESLESALAGIMERHAVLVVGFSGADLAYDRDYLGLRRAVKQCPAFVVLNRAGSRPLSAMEDLVSTASPRARIVDGELPGELVELAAELAPGITLVNAKWDAEMELPGFRDGTLAPGAASWAGKLGPVRCANILASLVESAGSSHQAFGLLRGAHARLSDAEKKDRAYPRHLLLIGRHLIERGDLEPRGGFRDDEFRNGVPFRNGNTAIELLGAATLEGRLDAMAELARAWTYVGRGDLALLLARGVPAMTRKARVAMVALDALLALGVVHRLNGDATTALALLEEAHDFARTVGDEPRRARACAQLVPLLAGADRFDDAEARLEDGLKVARNLGQSVLEMQLHVGWGRMENARGRFDEAVMHLHAACAAYFSSRLLTSCTDALVSLWEAAVSAGNDQAKAYASAGLDKLLPRLRGLGFPRTAPGEN